MTTVKAELGPAVRSGLAVTLNTTGGTAHIVTSAGLFLPTDEGKEFSVSTSGIPSQTRVLAYIDANTIHLTADATAAGSRTATIGAHVYLVPNQGTINPTFSKLDEDWAYVDVPAGWTRAQCVLSCNEIAVPSASSDSYLKWALGLEDDELVTPIGPSATDLGRRVILGGNLARRATMLFPAELDGSAQRLYWMVAGGNQAEIAPPNVNFALKFGGTRGVGFMMLRPLVVEELAVRSQFGSFRP